MGILGRRYATRRNWPRRSCAAKGMPRNIAVALGNSGDRSALDALIETAAEPTKRDPLVNEHVQ